MNPNATLSIFVVIKTKTAFKTVVNIWQAGIMQLLFLMFTASLPA
jgi:hypothetical protein